MVSEAKDGQEAVYEAFQIQRQRQEASWVECMKMQVAADVLTARRQHEQDTATATGKRAAAKRARDERRQITKTESITCVTEL
jgi:hypothetical protein